MKIRKLIAQDPTSREASLKKMIASLEKSGDKKVKESILEVLEDESLSLGSQGKNVAIELVEKTGLIEAIPALYPMLKIPVVSGIGDKVNDPFNAMVAIGKEGSSELIRSIEADDMESIPYQVIANIFYHWFDGDRSTLRAFLIDQEKISDEKLRAKFKEIRNVVDSWTN